MRGWTIGLSRDLMVLSLGLDPYHSNASTRRAKLIRLSTANYIKTVLDLTADPPTLRRFASMIYPDVPLHMTAASSTLDT